MPVLEWVIPPAIAQFSSSPLFISNIAISQVTERDVMITWETNRPCDSLLEYQAVHPQKKSQIIFFTPR